MLFSHKSDRLARARNKPSFGYTKILSGARESLQREEDYGYEYSQPTSSNRCQSVGPSNLYTYDPMTSGSTKNQQRHRSVDGMDLLSDREEKNWPGYSSVDVSLSNEPSRDHFSGSGSFPNSSSEILLYELMESFFSVEIGVGENRLNDTRYRNELESLKNDYDLAVQKLNEFMYTIKTFWSPEVKRLREQRKVDKLQIAMLQEKLSQQQNTGTSSFRELELERELENCRYNVMVKDETIRRLEHGAANNMNPDPSGRQLQELELRCRQLDSLVAHRDQQLHRLEEQMAELSFSSSQRDATKDRRIEELLEEITTYKMNVMDVDAPRDYTDKTISAHELHTLRMKMERSEVELADKISELSAVQTRLQSAGEENVELQKHLRVLRDSVTAKEQQAALLQSDIEALRTKLENKNEQIDQKEKKCERLEAELSLAKSQASDLREFNKVTEQRMNHLVARLDAMEALLKEKENELDKIKQKLLSQPDLQNERKLQMQLEESNRDTARLRSIIDDLRRNAEKEKAEQLETFQKEHRQLTTTIESLQKELSDRQILLESQNEKIGDLDRELCDVAKLNKDTSSPKTQDEQLAEARKEIDSLLRMVQNLEKEKVALVSKNKQLQSVDDEHRMASSSIAELPKDERLSEQFVFRIEELEEALRESVSITAERELHVAQQKQLNQQLSAQLAESRREVCELHKRLTETTSVDQNEIAQQWETERMKQLEQLLQLKHEALVAAIAEKDAHIALLEQSRERPKEEIETLRQHKGKLMEKLTEENERRDDDAEGIWA
uniref:Trichohyalin n=1 Tax=Syphacia muris TaxID=451379 RepID=A0A0N5AD53_9BILA